MDDDLPPLPHNPLEWVGRALEELKELPAPVQRSVGYALRFAQAGVKADNVKPLKGFKVPACWKWSRTPTATRTALSTR